MTKTSIKLMLRMVTLSLLGPIQEPGFELKKCYCKCTALSIGDGVPNLPKA
jgi:hypothetical protein